MVFSLPAAPQAAQRASGRLEEVFDLLNMDKEEQAIEPDLFTGNLKDYPDWLRQAFQDPALIAELEKFCEFEPGELAEWDLESWYEDLFTCDAWDFRVRKRRDGRHELTYEVEEEHYGGDLSHAWILLAAGATGIEGRRSQPDRSA